MKSSVCSISDGQWLIMVYCAALSSTRLVLSCPPPNVASILAECLAIPVLELPGSMAAHVSSNVQAT